MLTARFSTYSCALAVWTLVIATVGHAPLTALAVLLLGEAAGALAALVAASAPTRRDPLRRLALLGLRVATDGTLAFLVLIVLDHVFH